MMFTRLGRWPSWAVSWLAHLQLKSQSALPNLIKNTLSLSLNYPWYSQAYLASVERHSSDANELEQYRATQSSGRGARAFRTTIMVISVLYTIRAASFTVPMVKEINLRSASSNIIPLRPRTDSNFTYRFSCLVSNCVRLASASDLEALAAHLLEMPHFQMCHPILSTINDISQHMGSRGILMATGLSFGVLLSGLVLPLILINFPTGNFLTMFLAAPKVTGKLVELRVRLLLDELLESFANFIQCRLHQKQHQWRPNISDELQHLAPDNWPAAARRALGGSRSRPAGRGACRGCHHNRSHSCSCPAASQPARQPDERQAPLEREAEPQRPRPAGAPAGQPRSQTPVADSRQWQFRSAKYCAGFASDCVTIMRTDWWLVSGRRMMSNIAAAVILVICLAVLLVPYQIHSSVAWKRLMTKQLGLEVAAANCSIWSPGPGEHQLVELRLEHLELHFSLAMTLLYTIQCALPLTAICFMLITFWMTITELTCWLYELKFVIRLSQGIVDELLSRKAKQQPLPSSAGQYGVRFKLAPLDEQQFPLGLLREQFRLHIRVGAFLLDCQLPGNTSSRLRSSLAAHNFTLDTIESHRLGLEAAVELLEKLYISFRIYLDHVRYYTPLMTIMILFANIYIYGYVAIGVWFMRALDQFFMFSLAMILFGWSTTNLFIWAAANLNAKAKELHLLIWSLVAVTSKSRDIRVMHMNALWRKQVQALDMDCGLALRAASVRITYTRIIQIIIGSGTLIVFALR